MRVFSGQSCVVDIADTVCKNILDICRKKDKKDGRGSNDKDFGPKA